MRSDSPRRRVDREQRNTPEALAEARRFNAATGAPAAADLNETIDALAQLFSPAVGYGDLPEPWWSELRATVARLSAAERAKVTSAAWTILALDV
jgi:hypothetical protein